jgi:hypothetical protein
VTGAADFARVKRKVDATIDGFDAKGIRRILIGVAGKSSSPADDAKGDVRRAVTADFGADLAMSNWRRTKPVKMRARDEFVGTHAIAIEPSPSKGPWQVAEDGRRGGKPVPKRSGRRVILATPWGPRTFTGANPMIQGGSRPKRTWSTAARAMRSQTQRRVDREKVSILRKAWR